MRAPFVDTVEPAGLGVRLVIAPSDPFQMEIWAGAYQPHVVHFLLRSVRPGDRVLCAGLHVGYIAALARRLAGPTGLVLSAEPDPTARAWATRNLELSSGAQAAPVRVLEGGLSAAPSELRFYQSSVMGHSSFAVPHHAAGEIAVPVLRGDDWLASIGVESLDVIVLDIEGWEVHALRGLTATIGRSPRLRAVVELSGWALRDAGTSPAQLVELWREHGFCVRWASTFGQELEYGVWGPEVSSGEERPAGDVICTPRSR